MYKRDRLQCVVSFLVCTMMLFSCGDPNPSNNQDQSKTKIRVIHLSYDAASVDIFSNETKSVTALSYTNASAYTEVQANVELRIKVTETGKNEAIFPEQAKILGKDQHHTIFAVGKASERKPLVFLEDDNTDPPQGKAKVRVFHGSPDAPTVQIKTDKADGSEWFKIAFGTGTAYKEVDAGAIKIVLTEEGKSEALASYQAFTFEAGKVYTIVTHGTFDSNDQVNFGLRAFIDNGAQKGKDFADLIPEANAPSGEAKVRVLHMSYDAPAVDVTVNDAQTPAVQALSYGASSGYATVPAGTPQIKVTETGKTSPALFSTS
ncbi:MAG: DUF4397 domain-containing protein, partial [Myxococcota bacterium]